VTNTTKAIGGAVIVGVLAFATGLGLELSESLEDAAKSVGDAGLEALVAAVAAAIGGWVLTHQKPPPEAHTVVEPINPPDEYL
jgi:hypothetical protein